MTVSSTTKAAPSATPPAAAIKANGDGVAALQKGDYAAAVVAFSTATQADPEALPLWINLAHACRLAGDVAGEKMALDHAIRLDQLDFGAQLRLAQWFQKQGEEASALIAWHHVEQLAAQQPQLAPGIAEELAEGLRYSATLHVRVAAAADAVVGASTVDCDETENRRIRAFVDRALGRRAIYTNRCEGLHYPFLPADEYFDAKHFTWLAELEAATPAIQRELADVLANVGDELRPYVEMPEGSPPNLWTPLDRSLDWSAMFLWKFGKPNHPVLDRCPETAAVLARLPVAYIPGRAPNAFFSLLRPGSHIPPHIGVTNTRATIHLALDIPPDCGFRVGGETREWVEGKAFAFDDTIEHEAWNRSDRRRAILIIDAWNPHLTRAEREAILNYYRAADTALAGPVL